MLLARHLPLRLLQADTCQNLFLPPQPWVLCRYRSKWGLWCLCHCCVLPSLVPVFPPGVIHYVSFTYHPHLCLPFLSLRSHFHTARHLSLAAATRRKMGFGKMFFSSACSGCQLDGFLIVLKDSWEHRLSFFPLQRQPNLVNSESLKLQEAW